jgi:hypothetical protein
MVQFSFAYTGTILIGTNGATEVGPADSEFVVVASSAAELALAAGEGRPMEELGEMGVGIAICTV